MPTQLNFARLKQIFYQIGDPLVRRVRFNGVLKKNHDQTADEELLRRARKHVPVFVFQMGKVASTSIYKSLQTHYEGPVFHAHSFEPFHGSPEIRALHRYHQAQNPIKIISLIREPVTRNISAFFQNFKRDTGRTIEESNLSAIELKRMFLNNYPHEIPLVWFDNNIQKHFGIDVYSRPFPQSGHDTFSQDGIELLVMRHDLDDSVKEALVQDFAGLQDFCLESENVGAEKRYAELYELLKQVKLPLQHLHYLASSKYMHHFFKDDMREILCTWSDEPLESRKTG